MRSRRRDGAAVRSRRRGGAVETSPRPGRSVAALPRPAAWRAARVPERVVENFGGPTRTPAHRRREAVHELRADYKETDLFKVYQVPQDLGTIERAAPDLAQKAPALLRVPAAERRFSSVGPRTSPRASTR